EYFKSLFPDIRIANQVYGNIGQKMYSALCAEYKQRYQKICLIGTDCPDLTPGIILRAFKHLAAHSVVVGPAKDGGYYLLGLKQPLKEIFMKIPWSTPQVCEMTLARLRQINSRYKLLELRQDIDDYQDLKTYLQKPKNLRLKQILLEILKQ
ncbi:TIGR04282 family arsenosugar biosynthesis glycosyltransferase, partial [bacterium]|nr:TIGR04282 family arsenosugar biosynthesis glycosyltransferase [bacterium]